MRYRIEKTKVVVNTLWVNVNLLGNAKQVYGMFLNLILDALKFLSTNTNLVVSISLKDKVKFWQFAIRGNAIGIAAEDHHKPFMAFNRLHSRESVEGSKLGLTSNKKSSNSFTEKDWLNLLQEKKGHFILL